MSQPALILAEQRHRLNAFAKGEATLHSHTPSNKLLGNRTKSDSSKLAEAERSKVKAQSTTDEEAEALPEALSSR